MSEEDVLSKEDLEEIKGNMQKAGIPEIMITNAIKTHQSGNLPKGGLAFDETVELEGSREVVKPSPETISYQTEPKAQSENREDPYGDTPTLDKFTEK